MPIKNWWDFHEKKDVRFLLKTGKKVNRKALKVAEMLQSEFIDVFGIDKGYSEILKKEIEIELLRIKISKTGDKSHQIFIEIAERELEVLTAPLKDKKINSNTIHIEKYMGFKLNSKEITVFEYYSYIKAIEKEQKAA